MPKRSIITAIWLLASSIAIDAAGAQSAVQSVTRIQVVTSVTKHFTLMDANHDGTVTKTEFQAYLSKHPVAVGPQGGGTLRQLGHVGRRWFEHADISGDGHVTIAEAEAEPLRLFDQIDTNNDGIATPEEQEAATAALLGVSDGR